MGNQTSAIDTAPTTTIIRRTFYADGALHSQWFNKDFTDSLVYTYDASGARTSLKHIIVAGSTTRVDSVTYLYNSSTGDLDSLAVRWGNPVNSTRTFKFTWDALGRRRQITYPNGTTVKSRYDAAGRLRRLVALHPNGTNDVLDLTFRNRAVDPAGRILWQELACGTYGVSGSACGSNMVSTWNGYDRRGMLVRQVTGTVVDSSRYDASGNLIQRRPRTGIPYTSYSVASSHNELALMVDSGSTHRLRFTYDSNGARTYELDSTSVYRTRGYYYDGMGRTVGTRGYLGQSLYNNAEACQYGPDGQMNKPCENGAPTLAMDGPNTVAAYNGSGFASFVHAPGLDDPLIGLVQATSGGTTRELYFVTDGAGREFAVGDSTGAFDAGLDQSDQWLSWRYSGGSKSSNTFGSSRLAAPTVPGLSFFRNRVYDQTTGRWTQEDPVGAAAGMNVYQFNMNDPVAYADPFGLTPCDKLRRDIATKLKAFMKDWRQAISFRLSGRYDAGHQEELFNWQKGLEKDTKEYDSNGCDDDDDHDGFAPTLEKAKKFMRAPIPEPNAPKPAPYVIQPSEALRITKEKATASAFAVFSAMLGAAVFAMFE
jgi:RHS repeat-associated protein